MGKKNNSSARKKTGYNRKKKQRVSYKKRRRYIKEHKLKRVSKSAPWELLEIEKAKRESDPEFYDKKYGKPRLDNQRYRAKNKTKKDYTERLYTLKEFLYIGWADKSENFDIKDIMGMYNNYSGNELTRKSQEILQFYGGKDNSSGMQGNVFVYYGNKLACMNLMINLENKKPPYQTLCMTNKFTAYGLKKFLCTALRTSTEENRVDVLSKIDNFLSQNSKELHHKVMEQLKGYY